MNARIVLTSVLTMLVIAATVAPASARAQATDTSMAVLTTQPILTSPPSVDATQPAGPVIAPVGATRSMAMAPVSIPAQNRSRGAGVGTAKAMMGVGLAAVVVGIVVGGDVGTLFIAGGGVIGLIGLYRYLQ